MHIEAYEYICRMRRKYGPRRNVLEIGSRNVNGSVRGVFQEANYFGIDVAEGPGVDREVDAEYFDAETTYDGVVCVEVLEHAVNGKEIIQCAYRCLVFGGLLYLTCAGPKRTPHTSLGGTLNYDEFYGNVTDDLSAWLDGFIVTDLENNGVDVRLVGVKYARINP